MSTIESLPLEMLEQIVFFIVPEDSYKCPHCRLCLLKPISDWRHTLKALRSTCKTFANMLALQNALFHTIRFYTSPRNLSRLEGLSNECASLVKRAVFHDPIFPKKLETLKKYQNQLRDGFSHEHTIELDRKGFSELQKHACLMALKEVSGPYKPVDTKNGFSKYSMCVQEQQASIENGHYVESWSHILNQTCNLEEIVVRSYDPARSTIDAEWWEQSWQGYEWCTCERNARICPTDLEALHPEVLLRRDTRTNSELYDGGVTCLKQVARALALSRTKLKALTVGPGIYFNDEFDWTQIKGWRFINFDNVQTLDFSGEEDSNGLFGGHPRRLYCLLERMRQLFTLRVRNDNPFCSDYFDASISRLANLTMLELNCSIFEIPALEDFLYKHSSIKTFRMIDAYLDDDQIREEDVHRLCAALRALDLKDLRLCRLIYEDWTWFDPEQMRPLDMELERFILRKRLWDEDLRNMVVDELGIMGGGEVAVEEGGG